MHTHTHVYSCKYVPNVHTHTNTYTYAFLSFHEMLKRLEPLVSLSHWPSTSNTVSFTTTVWTVAASSSRPNPFLFPPLSPGRGSAVASSCPGWELNKWGFEGDLCQSDGEGLQPSGGLTSQTAKQNTARVSQLQRQSKARCNFQSYLHS